MSFWDKFSNYTETKARYQSQERANIFYNIIMNNLVTMLEYENVPDEIDPRLFTFIELYKLLYGTCYVNGSSLENIVLYHGGFAGEPDIFGMGKHYVGATRNGQTIDEDWHNGVIFKNNRLYTSEALNVERFAEQLGTTDLAQAMLVKMSMAVPTIFVRDSKLKKALEHVYDLLSLGKPAFLSGEPQKNYLISDLATDKPLFERVDISDPTLADKLQYLSHYTDDLQRRLYTYYGISSTGTQKMAQQTVDEITATDKIARIYPLERLMCAREDIEIFNEKFGTNITVTFSEAVRHNLPVDELKPEELTMFEEDPEETDENEPEETDEGGENEDEEKED